MQFQEGNIYHIYNQGNNRQKIFFNRFNVNILHKNPVKESMAKREMDWEFSPARYYAGLRNWYLISKEITRKYI